MDTFDLKKYLAENPLLKEITEGKQVGTLYHFTKLIPLIRILETNTLKGSNTWDKSEKPFVSFTRNKNGWHVAGGKNVRIAIDGDKLSNNYKISPFDMQNLQSWDNAPLDEMEERVFGDINNITNYITEILVQSREFEGYSHLKDRLEILYPDFKTLNKISRRGKLIPYDEVFLPLTDDVKQYIDDTLTKEKIEYSIDFPKYEMIAYFNKKLNTKYDSISGDVEDYIESKVETTTS